MTTERIGLGRGRSRRDRRRQSLLAPPAIDPILQQLIAQGIVPPSPVAPTVAPESVRQQTGPGFWGTVGNLARYIDPVRAGSRLLSTFTPTPEIGIGRALQLIAVPGETVAGTVYGARSALEEQLGIPLPGMTAPITAPMKLGRALGRMVGGREEPDAEQLQKERESEARKRGAAEAFRGLFTDPGMESVRGMIEAQRERPMGERLLSEFVLDPLNIIPGVGFVKMGQKGAKAARAAKVAQAGGVRRYLADVPVKAREVVDIEPQTLHFGKTPAMKTDLDPGDLPIVDQVVADIMDQVHDPKKMGWLPRQPMEKVPGAEWSVRKFSKGAVMNPKNPIQRAVAVAPILESQRAGIVDMQMRELNARFGDFNKLWPNMDKDGVVTLASGNKVSWQMIAQHPAQYAKHITPEQARAMKFMKKRIASNEELVASYGGDLDPVLDTVKGDYWFNMWTQFQGLDLLNKGVKRPLGATQFMEQSRLIGDSNKAFEYGWTAHPLEQFKIGIEAQLKRGSDAILMKILKKAGMELRDQPKLIDDAFNDAKLMQGGAKSAARAIKYVAIGVKKPRKRSAAELAYFTKANMYAPDLMEKLQKAEKLTGTERINRLDALKAEVAQRLKIADEQLKIKMDMKRRIAPLKTVGDREYPLSAFAERFKDADEGLDHMFPHLKMAQHGGYNKADLEDLGRILTGQPGGNAFLRGTKQVGDAARAIVAGPDASWLFIQGLPLLFTHPTKWARASKFFIQGFRDPQAVSKEITNHWSTLEKLNDAGQLDGAGIEMLEGFRQGGLLDKQIFGNIEKIPGANKIVDPIRKGLLKTNEQFSAANLLGKVYLWEALEPMAKKSFAAGNQNAYTELADSVAKMMGSANTAKLGLNPTAEQVMGSFALFAQRYFFSITGFMTDAAKGGLKGEVARNQLGKFMLSGALAYSAAAYRLKQTPNLNPTDPDFMMLDIGNQKVGIGTKYISLARFGSNFLTNAVVHPDKILSFSDRDSAGRNFVRFLRGQTAIPGKVAWDVATGRDYLGEETRGWNLVTNVLPSSTLPIWLQSTFDERQAGWRNEMVGAAGEFMGGRSHPVSLYEQGMELADIASYNEHGIAYKDLPNDLMRQEIRKANPRIDQLFDENNEIWAGKGNRVNQYKSKIIEWDEIVYRPKVEQAESAFERTRDGKKFRDTLRSLNLGRRLHRELLTNEEDGEFADVIELFNERRDQRVYASSEYIGDIAYDDYISNVVGGSFEDIETGEFNYRGWNDARGQILSKYGSEVFDYVLNRLEVNSSDLVKEYYAGKNAPSVRHYFSTGENILRRTGNDNLIDAWSNYTSSHQEEKEELDFQYPLFKSLIKATTAARKLLRDQNPQLEAWLIRFGYLQVARHPQNIDREAELRSTPVSFAR
jgi:hypothetical protein